MYRLLALLLVLTATSPGLGQSTGNLLRNADFQDDWLTLIPENKNHHWCYSSEFYNRRDFNPDAWECSGNWEWRNADAPMGQRQLVLLGPKAEVSQRINWVLVHDSKQMGSMADAGGFPSIVPMRSKTPLKLVRDLTLRVWLDGKDAPAKAGSIELSLCPPGALAMAHPHGTKTKPTITVSSALPEGSYSGKVLEVKLPAQDWWNAVQNEAKKDAKEAAELAKSGAVLPGTLQVAIRYAAAKGEVKLLKCDLVEPGPSSPNLLPNGSFQSSPAPTGQPKIESWPTNWGAPAKYRHFPGRLYYLFNTWHNGAFDNKGTVRIDTLSHRSGPSSLQMIVPPGDEVAVSSDPITLNQTEPRLIEVHAWVKTDHLAMLHLDALDETGQRLDGFPFIHMAPHSIGTDGWRLIRQVFRPRKALQRMRVMLCARGVNGYTLDDTGHQPQNNVVGTIWWDDVQLFEPESTAAELAKRGVAIVPAPVNKETVHIQEIDLGERMFGANVLTATVFNPGKEAAYSLHWEFENPRALVFVAKSPPKLIPQGKATVLSVEYQLGPSAEPYPPYSPWVGTLSLRDSNDKIVAKTQLSFSTWTVPIDLELGALYLRPDRKQFVRMNVGLSHADMKNLAKIKLETVRRSTGKVLHTQEIAATPAAILQQRQKLPDGLRDDLTNLLLADVDVSALPVQPFADPQRNWIIRATAIDKDGKPGATVESQPFCRLAQQPPQPAVQSVKIKNDLLYVNDQPWLPWGAVYGHVPVYDGPADPGAGKYLDLHNLKPWSMYDRFTAAPYKRQSNDFNCLRYVAGSITDPKLLDKLWKEDNIYASTVFAIPQPAYSIEEMVQKAGGADKLGTYLVFCKTGPMVISTAPGIEEAFGLFHAATPQQLQGLAKVVHHLRAATGKPVMVSHGGYWNRFEFEKVPFFDIYDPETEPLYPANVHTDLVPLFKGKNKVFWLRPQMYESVPYERWRFHVFVELMRGCTGWQVAHGPGDASLFRGLHGELEFFKPIIYSAAPGPKITTHPPLEHWSRSHLGKTYVIAASTRPLALGKWRWQDEGKGAPAQRSRVTGTPHQPFHEANNFGADQEVTQGPAVHGIHYLPDARAWPAGTTLVQWVRLSEHPKLKSDNLAILFKQDGRWTHAAHWGQFDPANWHSEPKKAMWFLHSFYRHAYGFLGWDDKLLDKAKPYLLTQSKVMGPLPAADKWVKLEIPLEQIGIKGGLLDGVAFAHEKGQVWWGPTLLRTPDGKETTLFGQSLEHPPDQLEKTRINVPGLKAGTKIRVLFEDRELTAGDGFFIDDFRGQDLYQRHGGGYGVGYGEGPVALHLYEVAGP